MEWVVEKISRNGKSWSRTKSHEAAVWLGGIELGAGVVSLLTITVGLGGQPSFATYWYLSIGINVLGIATLLTSRWLSFEILFAQLVLANFGVSFSLYTSQRTDPAVISMVFYTWITLYAFSFLKVRWAVYQSVLSIAGFAIAISLSKNFTAPLGDVMFIAGTVAVTGVFTLRLVKKLSRLSNEDQLTGLPNRRFLEEHLGFRDTSDLPTNKIFSAAIIDLDDFKIVNDTKGHIAGDITLKSLAHRWRPQIRKGDVLARWGGDEFLLIMNNSSEEEIRKLLVRLFEQASDYLTISVGYGTRMPGETISDLLLRCDIALYQAKKRLHLHSAEHAIVSASSA